MSVIKANTISNIPDDLKGILFALVSTGLFVVSAMLVRVLSDSVDTFQILLFRQIVFIVVLMPAIKSNIAILLKPQKLQLHVLRITGAFFALYFGFIAVGNLPFADAQALGFLHVLFVAFISRTFLSEQLTLSRIFTISAGFIGVIMVVQPEFYHASLFYILIGALGALGAAVAVVSVRKIAQTEPKITLLAYQAVFVGFIALIPSITNWYWPNFEELGLLILVGLLSSAGQWFGVTAYKFGQANLIANVQYVSIIYSLLLGYFIFSEVPDNLALAGAAILILSALIPQLFQWARSTISHQNTVER
ncbi:DMT family transporter [Vibrio sp. SCSIO 43137]|uniref:DMT family transporter n=1 Tax=Vibrio sp. SCSIO 43137 TaxID=3021011 RepID=UPI00230777C0|nr:DMT family transporter [Vibrio sp. SCSIO 43137]WCE31518.1 DMT family transporter [Vibrio sp. SCSIO 43137]